MRVLGHMVTGGAHDAHAVPVHLLLPLLAQSGHVPGLSRLVAVLVSAALRPGRFEVPRDSRLV